MVKTPYIQPSSPLIRMAQNPSLIPKEGVLTTWLLRELDGRKVMAKSCKPPLVFLAFLIVDLRPLVSVHRLCLSFCAFSCHRAQHTGSAFSRSMQQDGGGRRRAPEGLDKLPTLLQVFPLIFSKHHLQQALGWLVHPSSTSAFRPPKSRQIR